MSKRHRIHRNVRGYSIRYQAIEPSNGELSRTTLLEMANRMAAAGATGSLEVFASRNAIGERQDLYTFIMIDPQSVADLSNAFCSALVGLIERGILPPGADLVPFLPRNFAPRGNTGLRSTEPPQTAGDEGPAAIILPERLDGSHLN